MRMFQSVYRSLGTMLTNRNKVHDKQEKYKVWNVCQYSVRKLNILSTFQNAENYDV